MDKEITKDVSALLKEIVWKFGSQGLDGQCCGNLTAPEMRALRSVSACADCSMQNLAQTLGFTKGGATRVVDRLEKKKMVKRVRSSADGRVCCVQITKSGDDMLRRVNEQTHRQVAQILDKMDPNMRQILRTALAALVEVS
jgi:DNA-binding MarR family transcriptional regulator